jgi:endoglucanase
VDRGGGARPVNPHGEAKADIAGITAASLALMSRLWRGYDVGRASAYLSHAKEIYEYGKSHRGTTPDHDGYYADESYVDDMLCGAVELYNATHEERYIDEAIDWDDMIYAHSWVVDWSNTVDYCRHSLMKAGWAGTANYWKDDVENYLGKISNASNVRGLAFFSEWGSLRYATGAAFSAALLYDRTGTQSYRAFAEDQLAYVLGDNEYGRSFVIDHGRNAPTDPHHRNAYNSGIALTGALVGGPNSNGYTDSRFDYVDNEVTIDYNTGLVGLAAFKVAQERRR